jgi:tetratricopeptide (TPR) repeat protein
LHNLKDDYQKAIADANRAIQIDPRNIAPCIDAYFARGFAHLRLKDYEQAVLDLTAGLKLDPKDRTALLHRAAAFVYLGKYNEAVADLRQASKLDSKSTDAFNGLAWLLATCPDPSVRNGGKATEYISRALQRDPNQWKLWDTRAAVFAENGDFGNAVLCEGRCLERKDLSEAERHRATERLALYRARKPYREEPK